MTQRIWATGAALAIVLAGTGCVSCGHKSYAQVRDCATECAIPVGCRNPVHVFLIHGITPTTACGLEALREKLSASGFAKVGVGELASGFCIQDEINKIYRCDPDAKFVLIGFDFGGSAANCIARDLNAKGIPVEAVVLLDPVNCGKPSGVRTLLITSGSTLSGVPHTDRLVVADANHFHLPGHPSTVSAVTNLLQEIAASCIQSPIDPVPEWIYEPAPEMRPLPVATGGEWDFLAERGGVPRPIGTRVLSETR